MTTASLVAQFRVWHESLCSAREDDASQLCLDGLCVHTPRPAPMGTRVFVELPMGPGQARWGVDAQVEGVDEISMQLGFLGLDAGALETLSLCMRALAVQPAVEQPASTVPVVTPHMDMAPPDLVAPAALYIPVLDSVGAPQETSPAATVPSPAVDAWPQSQVLQEVGAASGPAPLPTPRWPVVEDEAALPALSEHVEPEHGAAPVAGASPLQGEGPGFLDDVAASAHGQTVFDVADLQAIHAASGDLPVLPEPPLEEAAAGSALEPMPAGAGPQEAAAAPVPQAQLDAVWPQSPTLPALEALVSPPWMAQPAAPSPADVAPASPDAAPQPPPAVPLLTLSQSEPWTGDTTPPTAAGVEEEPAWPAAAAVEGMDAALPWPAPRAPASTDQPAPWGVTDPMPAPALDPAEAQAGLAGLGQDLTLDLAQPPYPYSPQPDAEPPTAALPAPWNIPAAEVAWVADSAPPMASADVPAASWDALGAVGQESTGMAAVSEAFEGEPPPLGSLPMPASLDPQVTSPDVASAWSHAVPEAQDMATESRPAAPPDAAMMPPEGSPDSAMMLEAVPMIPDAVPMMPEVVPIPAAAMLSDAPIMPDAAMMPDVVPMMPDVVMPDPILMQDTKAMAAAVWADEPGGIPAAPAAPVDFSQDAAGHEADAWFANSFDLAASQAPPVMAATQAAAIPEGPSDPAPVGYMLQGNMDEDPGMDAFPAAVLTPGGSLVGQDEPMAWVPPVAIASAPAVAAMAAAEEIPEGTNPKDWDGQSFPPSPAAPSGSHEVLGQESFFNMHPASAEYDPVFDMPSYEDAPAYQAVSPAEDAGPQDPGDTTQPGMERDELQLQPHPQALPQSFSQLPRPVHTPSPFEAPPAQGTAAMFGKPPSSGVKSGARAAAAAPSFFVRPVTGAERTPGAQQPPPAASPVVVPAAAVPGGMGAYVAMTRPAASEQIYDPDFDAALERGFAAQEEPAYPQDGPGLSSQDQTGPIPLEQPPNVVGEVLLDPAVPLQLPQGFSKPPTPGVPLRVPPPEMVDFERLVEASPESHAHLLANAHGGFLGESNLDFGAGAALASMPEASPAQAAPLAVPQQDLAALDFDMGGSPNDPVPLATGAELVHQHQDNPFGGAAWGAQVQAPGVQPIQGVPSWFGADPPAAFPADAVPMEVAEPVVAPVRAPMAPMAPGVARPPPAVVQATRAPFFSAQDLVFTPLPPPPPMGVVPAVPFPGDPQGLFTDGLMPVPAVAAAEDEDLPLVVTGELLPPSGFKPAPAAQPGGMPPAGVWQPSFAPGGIMPPPPRMVPSSPRPGAAPAAAPARPPLQGQVNRPFNDK